MTKSNLKQKAVRGITWNLIERFGIQGMQFITGIMLARLLTPADFGLIGMITVFFIVAQVFVESGFGQSYIQKKEVIDEDADTIFYTNMAISFISYGILWISAPLISKFYSQPALIGLTRVMGIVIIINAFNVIQMAMVIRNVDFKKKTKVTLIATFVAGTAGILSAYKGLGVWSLVIQQIVNRFMTTAGLWMTSKWKPSLQFSKRSFYSLFSFGGWVLAGSIIRTLFDNIYILIIGKFYQIAQLGFYTKAKQIQQLTAEQVAGAVGSVAFPVLSQLQEDPSELKKSVRKFLTHTLVFTAPIMITLMVIAKPFVILLLTEKWAPMIPYLQLLCISGILYPIHLVNVQVLQAQGKSNLNFRLELLKNTLRIINISIMYRWGVISIIIGEIVVSFISLIINTYYTKKMVKYGAVEQLKDIKNIIIASVLAGVFAYNFSYPIINIYLKVITGTFATISVYILILILFNKILLFEIMKLKENL